MAKNKSKTSYQLAQANEQKGWWGEFKVKAFLFIHLKLLGRKYKVFHDVVLPTKTFKESRHRTTQVDHIVVCPFGVFVIETKNYKGRIDVESYAKQWRLTTWGKAYFFQNPLRQNYLHLMTLKELSKLPKNRFKSMVVFVGRSKFSNKSIVPKHVNNSPAEMIQYIKSQNKVLLTKKEMNAVIKAIKSNRHGRHVLFKG